MISPGPVVEVPLNKDELKVFVVLRLLGVVFIARWDGDQVLTVVNSIIKILLLRKKARGRYVLA